MDANTMTFEEILFHGRYHIIGGVLFLVFFGAFIREAVRELVTVWENRSMTSRLSLGRLFHDPVLGHTMTDGGEEVGDKPKKK